MPGARPPSLITENQVEVSTSQTQGAAFMQFTPPGLRMRPLFAAGMAFALCVAMTVRSTAADVGEWIPADALVVFKINNLQQVNQDAEALLREMGVAEQHPEAADPLGAF